MGQEKENGQERKIKWENLKREALIPLSDAGFTEEEIANILEITPSDVTRFKGDYRR